MFNKFKATVACLMAAMAVNGFMADMLADTGLYPNPRAIDNSIARAEAAINIYRKDFLETIRITWSVYPGAVSYRLAILANPDDSVDDAISIKKGIYENGYDFDSSIMRQARNYYWAVCPLDYDGQPMDNYSKAQPLADCQWNPEGPGIMSEYADMEYGPLYPVYACIPPKNAKTYDIKVSRKTPQGSFVVIRTLESDTNVFYDYAGFTWPGVYSYQMRGRDSGNRPCTNWSEPSYFTVEAPVKVAALGDSITHGGGACCTPPSYKIYDWECYSQVPIKNLGYSGDTVQAMLNRFDTDVLPFQPQILLIFGGVNNFRQGDDGWYIIDAMESIKNKCYENGIIPVFITCPPINERLISRVPTIEQPADNWKYNQQVLNGWIKEQQYWVDVTPGMTDENGRLCSDMTTDGLHPDKPGKELIGNMVSDYLLNTFPDMNLKEK